MHDRDQDKLNAIDFPCSYTWRSYYQETFYGEHLPPIDPLEPQPEVVPEIHYIPVEPKTHMTRVRGVEEDLQNFRNYVIKELLPLKETIEELSQRRAETGEYY